MIHEEGLGVVFEHLKALATLLGIKKLVQISEPRGLELGLGSVH